MAGTGKWLPVFYLSLLMMLMQFVGPEVFRYETSLIADFQLWRLLTGHWVHANWIHFLMNMAGFILCSELTGVAWTIRQWIWRILVLSSGISLGFYIWHPDISWYVGFSGVLFGLYILAAFASLAKQAYMSIALLVLIGLKIILEQVSSVNITTSDLIGIPVMVDAHLYGVLIAVSLILIQMGVNKLFQTNTTG